MGVLMYSDFSLVYDLLMDDVDYSRWADYIEALFGRYAAEPELILDLACGTGSLTLELAKRGYDMIGIDLSPDMLSRAVEKTDLSGVSPLWVCQDMRSFELYGSVDIILCTMDSLNYILDMNDMRDVFGLAGNYLNPGGLFIFDLNTPYKFEHVFADNLFYEIRDDIAYLWQNRYNPENKICDFDLTFFVRQTGDLYKRLEEQQKQRAWSYNEIKYVISGSGLNLTDVFNAFTFEKPSRTTERCFYIAQK
jgi:SAM-dependent methyltransferase